MKVAVPASSATLTSPMAMLAASLSFKVPVPVPVPTLTLPEASVIAPSVAVKVSCNSRMLSSIVVTVKVFVSPTLPVKANVLAALV